MAKNKELKNLLIKVNEKSEKIGLNIQKTKIMASDPITLWQIDGVTVETETDLILGAPKSLQMVTAAMKSKDTCSWKKSCDQPRQHIKKKKHYFADKGPLSQSHVLSGSQAWMWEYTTKKAEFWRIDAFKLWCWRRLSRVPWTAKSNQSILKEISSE